MNELPPPTAPQLSIENKEENEKKPVPPRSTLPEQKEFSTSRVTRFRDWCEIAGVPSEDVEEYAIKLKKYFNEHDEDSEQEGHDSYIEELDDIREDMWNKAMDKLEEMDAEDEEYAEDMDDYHPQPLPSQTQRKPQNITNLGPQQQHFDPADPNEIIYD